MTTDQRPLSPQTSPQSRGLLAISLCLTMLTAAIGATSMTGCASSTYRQRHPELLVQQMQFGIPVYVVDGRAYSASPLSDGLMQAVGRVPEARQLALASHDSMVAFLVTYLGSLVATGVGATMIVANQTTSGSQDRFGTVGAGVFLGGLVGFGSSIWFATRAEALRTDAVAAYNDAVLDRLRSPLSALPASPPPARPSERPQEIDEEAPN